MPEQRYSANDRRKDNMINHNESDLRNPEIEPGSPNSQSYWINRTSSHKKFKKLGSIDSTIRLACGDKQTGLLL
jgi:hypothetical protein